MASAQEAPPAEVFDDEESDTPATPSKGHWLPIPIFITEPAIGVGLGAALAYFHPRAEESDTTATFATPQPVGGPAPAASGRRTSAPSPPATPTATPGLPASATARRGARTGSGTWVLLPTPTSTPQPVPGRSRGRLQPRGELPVPGHQVRLASSDFFLGGKLFAIDADTAFEIVVPPDLPLPEGQGDTQDVGLAVQGYFDARDNTFTPNRGQLFTLDVWRYDQALGGDFSAGGAPEGAVLHQLHPSFVLGLRLEASAVSGGPPFWSYPWITLRGVPAMRYQNELAGVAEVEGRWNVLAGGR